MQQARTSQTVGEELSASESVHQIQLADDVDQTQEFAEEITNGIHVVLLKVNEQIVDEDALLGRTLFDRLQARVQAHDDRAHQIACCGS